MSPAIASSQASLPDRHKCYVCGQRSFTRTIEYKEPDKYELSIGITAGKSGFSRSWFRCNFCRLHFSSYTLLSANPMDPIYGETYRDMRGETTRQTFYKIDGLPFEKSESRQRVKAM